MQDWIHICRWRRSTCRNQIRWAVPSAIIWILQYSYTADIRPFELQLGVLIFVCESLMWNWLCVVRKVQSQDWLRAEGSELSRKGVCFLQKTAVSNEAAVMCRRWWKGVCPSGTQFLRVIRHVDSAAHVCLHAVSQKYLPLPFRNCISDVWQFLSTLNGFFKNNFCTSHSSSYDKRV